MPLGAKDCTEASMVLQVDFGRRGPLSPKRRAVSTNRQTADFIPPRVKIRRLAAPVPGPTAIAYRTARWFAWR